MISTFIRGLSFGGSLIVAIGAQNAFVIRQGLKQRHLFIMALLCATIDALLILFGVFGFGAFIEKYPALLSLAKYFAVAFLFVYGILSFRAAMKNNPNNSLDGESHKNLKSTVLAILAFSLLNPHVYLDTIILLGSIASQEPVHLQVYFAVGAVSASFIWFFSISYASSFCARWLTHPRTQKFIDVVVAITMWAIAAKLLFWS